MPVAAVTATGAHGNGSDRPPGVAGAVAAMRRHETTAAGFLDPVSSDAHDDGEHDGGRSSDQERSGRCVAYFPGAEDDSGTARQNEDDKAERYPPQERRVELNAFEIPGVSDSETVDPAEAPFGLRQVA